jgi:hypothetical protein
MEQSQLPGLVLVNNPTTPDTYFSIASVQLTHSSDTLTTNDGLNLAKLKAGDEFVFIGLSMDGTPKHLWIDRLAAVPLAVEDLTDGHFATITAPTSLSDVTIPGDVTVSWSMPTALTTFTQWVTIGWGDGISGWENRDMENPDYGDKEWTSTTFDTSATTVTTANYMYINVTTSPDDEMQFRSEVSLR